jgi:hypothetical protein
MKGRGRLLALIGIVGLGSLAFTGTPAGAIPGSGCTRPIVITRLAFGPGTILPSQKSTARLAGRNCTKHPRSVSIQWSGSFSGTSTTGCPVFDPFVQTITVPKTSALLAHVVYLVPKGCEATVLTVNARVTDAKSAVISNKHASLRIAHRPAQTAT